MLHNRMVPASVVRHLSERSQSLSQEINRIEKSLRREEVYSLGQMQTDDRSTIKLFADQFFIYDYENSFFFKHVAKRTKE